MHPVKEYLDDVDVEYGYFYGTGFDDSVTVEEMKNGEKNKFSEFLESDELDEWVSENDARSYQDPCHVVFNRETLDEFFSVMDENDEYKVGYLVVNDDGELVARVVNTDLYPHYRGGYDMENDYGKIYFETKSDQPMLPHFVFDLHDVNRVEVDGKEFVVYTDLMESYPEKHE